MSIFQCEHLSKSFNGKPVLKDISLKIEDGEIVAIIGPSGSGKTTFLRCATLLEKMDRGSLSYGEISVAAERAGISVYAPIKQLNCAREHFGLVFQNFNLFPHMSVLSNIIDAPVHIHHRNREKMVALAMSLLQKTGMVGYENAYPCELSGGQQQRVSIARAMALLPDILFFDEPTSALDPEWTNEILKIIRSLADYHMTIVLVTHDIGFAAKVADRIVFIADGVIVEDGPAKEVISHPCQERTRMFLASMDVKR